MSCLPVSYFYLTLEAACATTYEKKLYRAIFVRMIGDRKETILFGDVNSDGLLERIHDTRKGIKYRGKYLSEALKNKHGRPSLTRQFLKID